MEKNKLLEFDPANATDDQIRAWLFAIIAQELEKPEGQEDAELISECSECEMYLSGSESSLTKEQYLAGLASIKQRATNISEPRTAKPRVWRRLPILLAAVLALIVLSVGAVAAFNGSAALEFITTNIQEILGMNPGETLDGDKVTLVKGDLVAEYDSVEEALKAGGFEGILYPTELPEGVKIERIVHSHNGSEDNFVLTFVFNTGNISYEIYNYKAIDFQNWDDYDTLIINNQAFFIIYANSISTYQAGCYIDGFQYIISCNNHGKLTNILTHMKEVQQ